MNSHGSCRQSRVNQHSSCTQSTVNQHSSCRQPPVDQHSPCQQSTVNHHSPCLQVTNSELAQIMHTINSAQSMQAFNTTHMPGERRPKGYADTQTPPQGCRISSTHAGQVCTTLLRNQEADMQACSYHLAFRATWTLLRTGECHVAITCPTHSTHIRHTRCYPHTQHTRIPSWP